MAPHAKDLIRGFLVSQDECKTVNINYLHATALADIHSEIALPTKLVLRFDTARFYTDPESYLKIAKAVGLNVSTKQVFALDVSNSEEDRINPRMCMEVVRELADSIALSLCARKPPVVHWQTLLLRFLEGASWTRTRDVGAMAWDFLQYQSPVLTTVHIHAR